MPAQGGDAGRLHSGGAAADDHNLLFLFGGPDGEKAFPAHGGVDPAAARAAHRRIFAGSAARAAHDILNAAFRDLAGEFRVGPENTPEGHEIRLAFFKDLFGLGLVKTAYGDDRNVHSLLDGGSGGDEQAVAHEILQVGLHVFFRLGIGPVVGQIAERQRPEAVAGHADVPHARALENLGDGHGFRDGQPLVGTPLLTVHAQAEGIVRAETLAQPGDDFERQAGTVFEALGAILVVAAVPDPAHEAFQIVAVRAVDFDAVKPGGFGAFGGLEIEFLVLRDFFGGEASRGLAHRRGTGDFIRPEIGGADGQAAAVSGHGRGPGVVELAEHGAAVRVAAFHEALHAGEEPVVVERAVSPGGMVGTPCDGGYDHKPDPAGGDGFVKVNDPVPGRAVVLKKPA